MEIRYFCCRQDQMYNNRQNKNNIMTTDAIMKMKDGMLFCEHCGEEIRIVQDFEPEIGGIVTGFEDASNLRQEKVNTQIREGPGKAPASPGQDAVSPEKLVALAAETPGARLLPPAGLFCPLPQGMSVGEGLNAIRAKLETARLPR